MPPPPPPEPVSGNLFGKGVFAHGIKLKYQRDHAGLPQWTLNPMTSVIIGDQKGEDTARKEDQRQSHAAIRKADNHQKTEGRGGFSPQASRANVALPTP